MDVVQADHRQHSFFQRPDQIADPLYVVTVVFNSRRYRSRWRLWQDFEKRVAEAGAILYTVEVAFGDRAFAVTSADNPRHVQLRTRDEMWLKENGINVGVSRLPATAKYIAYIDADARPVRDDWANETIHALQHYACVQMWSQYSCLDSNMELATTSHSFMANYLKGDDVVALMKGAAYPYPTPGEKGWWLGPPGLAWGWRKDAWDAVGGLLDIGILGSGDSHMAFALVDRLDDRVVSAKFSKDYRAAIFDWHDRAKVLKKNVGMVSGLWMHYWHGPMSRRGYATRNQVLIDTQYSPVRDLLRDWQGLYRFTSRAPIALRDGVRAYLSARDEDQL